MQENMCAFPGAAPGVASTTIHNVDHSVSRSRCRDPQLKPYKASEKAQLVDCAGDWSRPEDHWCLEPINLGDLDPVSLDDFELKHHSSSQVYTTNDSGLKPTHLDTISRPNVSWSLRCNSWSTVESNDTIESSSSYAQSREFNSLDNITAATCIANENDTTVAPELPVSSRDCLLGDNPAETDEEVFEDDDEDSFISASVSTSQQSIWLSDYSESVAALGEDHPFQLIKPTIVLIALLAYRGWQYRTTGAPGNIANKESSINIGGAGRGGTSAGKKRNRGQSGDSEEEGENNNGDKAPGKKSRTFEKAAGHQALLACPYVKKDPVTYRNCYKYGLKRIQDVKLHLSRRHQLALYCPRCMVIFNIEKERDEHIRQSSCLLQEPILFEGVTQTQKERLSHRVPAKMTLEAQWFTIFEILFPGHQPRPKSAYIDAELSVDLEGFQDFMCCRGPNIVLEAIRSHGVFLLAMENEGHDLQAFLNSVVGDALQVIIQRWLATRSSERTSLSADANLPVPSSNGHSQPSATSSSTLHEQYWEGEIMNQLRAKGFEFDELDEDEMDQSFQEPLHTPPALQEMAIETPPIDHEQSNALLLENNSMESQYDITLDDCPPSCFEDRIATDI